MRTTDSTAIGTQLVFLDLEEIKIRDSHRIFGRGFRCSVEHIVGYVTEVTAGATAEKTSKSCVLIIS